MKISDFKQRLGKNRPMTTISVRMPEDVIEDLKRVAPLLGFSGYQPLLRAYVGQGLRADLERLEASPDLARLVESLKQQGVESDAIEQAIRDADIRLAKTA